MAKVKLLAIQPGPEAMRAYTLTGGEIDALRIAELAAGTCHNAARERSPSALVVFLQRLWTAGHRTIHEHVLSTCVSCYAPNLAPARGYGYAITLRAGPRRVVSANQRAALESVYLLPELPDSVHLDYWALSGDEKNSHALATFHITGISLSCAAHINSHRARTKSQLSYRRYRPALGEFIIPSTYENQPNARENFVNTVNMCIKNYLADVAAGIPEEESRYQLPVGVKTNTVITFPYWSLENFLNQRRAPDAQLEIQMLASEMWRLVDQFDPDYWDWLP